MRYSDDFIEELRRIPISDVIGSRVDWDRKSRPGRGDYWFCCPIHGETNASAHCDDRRGFFKCFSCGASGDHFRFFMDLDGVSFPRAIEMVAELAGIPVPGGRTETEEEKRRRLAKARDREQKQAERERQAKQDDAKKAETVRGLWQEAMPISGTLAESYLVGRGVPPMKWPPSLRFHPRLVLRGEAHPALLCGVQDASRKLVALWRIFLKSDGRALIGQDGRKVKLGLGPAGGGAVRLGPVGKELAVCEGVETGFGVGALTGWRRSVWPLLSTSGMTGWEPPDGVEFVAIYADGDRHKFRGAMLRRPPGAVAAEALKQKLMAAGIRAAIHMPPPGSDWLDVWNTRQASENEQRDIQYPA